MAKKIKPLKSTSIVGQVIKQADLLIDDKYFLASKGLNEERAKLLPTNKNFKKEILLVRKKLNIPNLLMEEDILLAEETTKSKWLELSGKKHILDEEIKKILQKCYLPINFYDWLESYILYGKKPSWSPIRSGFDLLVDYDRLNPQTPLTSGEKKYLTHSLRKIFDLDGRGRIPKKLSIAWKQFLNNLSKIKNTKRRYKNLSLYFKILTSKKEKIEDAKESGETFFREKTTYADIVPIIYNCDMSPKEQQKVAKRLRKIKSRHKETIKNRFKKN